MKCFTLLAALLMMMATACSNESEEIETEQVLIPVTVHVNGFTVSQADFTKTRAAQDIADVSNIKLLTLAFYKSDGTEVYKVTQNRDDATTYTTFGDFSLSLPMGNFTMVVLAHGQPSSGATSITLTSPTSATYGENRPWDTFAATDNVAVNNNNGVTINATLNRIVSAIQLTSTDNRTSDVAKVRIITSTGGVSFSPTIGLATVNTGVTSTIVPTASVGSTINIGMYLFLATDVQNADITIQTLDADNNVLFNETVSNVSLKRNRTTILTGAVFSSQATANSFQVNTDWITSTNVGF